MGRHVGSTNLHRDRHVLLESGKQGLLAMRHMAWGLGRGGPGPVPLLGLKRCARRENEPKIRDSQNQERHHGKNKPRI